METSHVKALRIFARKLQWLLTLRSFVSLATVWLFFWGVAILAMRMFEIQNFYWLFPGAVGILPLGWIAWRRAKARRAPFVKIRATYDQLNLCGGIIMSAETSDVDSWLPQLPEASVPQFRWRSRRALLLLTVSLIFVTVAVLLPGRLTHFAGRRSLQIGQIVKQLQAEVDLLSQEKIINNQQSSDLQKQLSQLQDDSQGYDPGKTWEALDHIKQFDSDESQQAAQEALDKMTSLTEAETLAKAMEEAADSGMNDTTASQAAQDLASMLNSAKLENGLLNVELPPQLSADLKGLNEEQMRTLLQALEANKGLLAMDISNLTNLKMVDPAMLAKLVAAGECNDPDALARYLCSCTNGCEAAMLCMRPGKGGPGRGGPEAPMTWSGGASEKDLKFQEHALPPASQLSSAQLIGVSKAAPELSGNEVSPQHGALDSATASGGSAHAQVILPEQREAVQSYFQRNN